MERTSDGKYKYLAKNTLLFTISSFGSKILTFLLVPLYTAVLSTSDYGIADVITATSGVFFYFAALSIHDAVLRFAIDRQEKQEEVLSIGLRVTFTGTGIFLIALALFRFWNPVGWPAYYFTFLYLILLANCINNCITNYLRAIGKIKQVAIAGIITTAVTILSNILLLLVFRWGIIGYLISSVVGSFVSACYCFLYTGNIVKILFLKFDRKPLRKEMLKYSIPLIFNGIAWWMNASIDKYFIVILCGTAVNGIYAVSQKIPTILSTFTAIFSQAWNLSAIKEFDKEDKDGFFAKTYATYNAFLVITCSGLILVNVFLAKILFSNDFFGAWQFASWLLLSTVFSSLSSFLGSIFSAVKNSRIFSVSTIIAAVVNMIFNAALIPPLGALGAAIATVVSFFTTFIIRWICARKYIIWKQSLAVDILVYALIVLQIVLERTAHHCYAGQVLIFGLIVCIYFKYMKNIVVVVLRKFRK